MIFRLFRIVITGSDPRTGQQGPFTVEELTKDEEKAAAATAAMQIPHSDTMTMLDAMETVRK